MKLIDFISFLDQSLANQNEEIFAKWRKYLQLKSQLYLSYAHAYCGEALLAEDKCGDAVRACREGITCEFILHYFNTHARCFLMF